MLLDWLAAMEGDVEVVEAMVGLVLATVAVVAPALGEGLSLSAPAVTVMGTMDSFSEVRAVVMTVEMSSPFSTSEMVIWHWAVSWEKSTTHWARFSLQEAVSSVLGSRAFSMQHILQYVRI